MRRLPAPHESIGDFMREKKTCKGMDRPEEPARARSDRKRPCPHGEKTAREKLEKKSLRGRSDAIRTVRDGFAGADRIKTRRLRLKSPDKCRRRAAAAHLYLESGSRAFVHGGEISGTLRGDPDTLRRKRLGDNRIARFKLRDGKQRQSKIQKQGTEESPGSGKAWPCR